jgi:hypothetical protein
VTTPIEVHAIIMYDAIGLPNLTITTAIIERKKRTKKKENKYLVSTWYYVTWPPPPSMPPSILALKLLVEIPPITMKM